MEQEIQNFMAQLWGFGDQFTGFLKSLMLPSRLRQIVIVLVLMLAAHVLKLGLSSPLHDWMRGLKGRSKAELRVLLMMHKRLRLIAFVGLIWLTIFVMNSVLGMFPSHTYILRIVGTISLAWLIVGVATRFIRNPLMRKIVNWVAWIYATLYFTGLTEDAAAVVDSVAIEIQDYRLSMLNILQAILFTGILVFGARLLSNTLNRWIQHNHDISPTLGVLISKIAQAALYVSAVFLGLRAVGFDPTGLTVLSGAIGVGIGFGLQKIVSNIVSGVIILMDKSVKPGDVISLGSTFGWIQSLGARYVSVVTRDGREYLIPNEDLITSQVVNWSHSDEFVRLDINFGTAYGSDPYLVRETAIKAALSVGRVLNTRQPVCHIVGFGDSSIDYVLRFWIRDPTKGLTNVRGDVNLALWDGFKAAGISFPFPQREVRLLSDDPAQAEANRLD